MKAQLTVLIKSLVTSLTTLDLHKQNRIQILSQVIKMKMEMQVLDQVLRLGLHQVIKMMTLTCYMVLKMTISNKLNKRL